MISSTFIALFLFSMPIVTGLALFGLSTVRTSAIVVRPTWEVTAGGVLAVLLLTIATLLLSPQWARQYVATARHRAEVIAADQVELAAADEMIARYESRQNSPPNPFWLKRWNFFAMDEPFPLETIDSKSTAKFLAARIAAHDEYLDRMEWRGAPRAVANHCEIRQWDAASGDWDHPVMVWFVRPPNAALLEGRLAYSGLAMINGGYPAQVLDAHEGDGDLEGGTRILERLFYNRYGGEFTAIPVNSDGSIAPPYAEDELFYFTSDTAVMTTGNAAHREALLRALPDDKFELVRQLKDGSQRHTMTLQSGAASDLRAKLDDPNDPADDLGFPVSAYFFDDEMKPEQYRIVVGVAKDRAVYRWRQENPNRPYRTYLRVRNVAVENNPQPSDPAPNVTHSARRWKYETNFSAMPVMYGSVQCVGRPPGEMKAIISLGRAGR